MEEIDSMKKKIKSYDKNLIFNYFFLLKIEIYYNSNLCFLLSKMKRISLHLVRRDTFEFFFSDL